MENSDLLNQWVSIQWDKGEDPKVGKILREERGFLIMESLDGKEVPFLQRSLYSLRVIEEPSQLKTNSFHWVWKWMCDNKLKTLFVSGVIIDFWANWYAYAIMHDWIVLQAFLGFFLPILNFPFIVILSIFISIILFA